MGGSRGAGAHEGWRVSHRRLSVPCLFGRLHGEYAMEEVDGEEVDYSRGGSRLFVLKDCGRRLEIALFGGG
jgi:hypothetical protein